METESSFEIVTDAQTDTDSTESFTDASDESFQVMSSSCDEDLGGKMLLQANKKRTKKNSLNKKAKKQKTSKSQHTKKKVLNKVLVEVFRMNTELDDLSKSVAILEQDISLLNHFPGIRSVYTMENLPKFPIATNTNQFQSGDVSVSIPVNTVEEANMLDTILKDKLTFEAVVRLHLNQNVCHEVLGNKIFVLIYYSFFT